MARTRKRKVINNFGDNFIVIENNGGYCLYDKDRYCKRANAQYLGKFYISNNGDKYVFNDEYFGTTKELIEAMDKYNATLPFSPEIYNPLYCKNYQIEMAVHDYLTSLGFKKVHKVGVSSHIYELYDAYEQKIFSIEIETVDNTTRGVMIRYIFQNESSYRMIKVPFIDLDSAIGACNSLISAYLTMLNVQMLNVFKTMTAARCSIMFDETFNLNTFSVDTKDARHQTIEYLEKELRQLKEE